MCRIKQRVRLCLHGKWQGSIPHLDYHPFGIPAQSPNGRATLLLPCYTSINAKNVAAASLVADPEPEMPLSSRRSRSKTCFITRLPMEVLLQIVGYLVPTESSFHVFPTTTTRYGEARCTYLHKFCEEATDPDERVRLNMVRPTRHHLTALAQTCQVLCEAYYATMYGKNHFIFELSPHPVYPVIVGATPPRVESWTTVVRGKRGVMWPVTRRTVPYAKRLTFLGSLYWKGEEWAKKEILQKILASVRMLKLAPRLKSLTIDLCSGLRPPHPKMPINHPSDGPNGRLAWSVYGPEDTMLRLRAPMTSDEHPSFEEYWEKFQDLRGISEVTLSGYISAEMAEKLRAKMMSDQTPVAVTQAARKVRGGVSKRKRSGESHRPSKSRRKA